MTDVQKWLCRGLWLTREIEKRKAEREELFARLTKITANVSGEVTSGTKDPHKFDILIALDVDIDNKIKALDRTLCEIDSAIQTLSDSRYRSVLNLHYVCGYTWEAVAEVMGYEVRQIYRIHGKALQAIEPEIKKETVD